MVKDNMCDHMDVLTYLVKKQPYSTDSCLDVIRKG